MTFAATPASGVTASQPRAIALAARRPPIGRGVAIGLGTATSTCLLGGAATVTAAWMIAVALGGAPHLGGRTPLALERAALLQSRAAFVSTAIAELAPADEAADTSAPFPPPPLSQRGKGPRLDATGAILPISAVVSASFSVFDPAPLGGDAPRFTGSLGAQPASTRFARAGAAVPLPAPRPDGLREPPLRAAAAPTRSSLAQVAEATPAPTKSSLQVADATPGPDNSSFLGRLLHRLLPQQRPDAAAALAAADSHTAIYDIEAHTVYMPDGSRLEAHSGLGEHMDDPRAIDKKARGPTPPNVYDLVWRDGLFHGVRAIRLNPVNDSKMYGRDGILAHPYMLGPSGQSFGCVSFKDYAEFQRAFKNGEVDRLGVVPHLDGKPALEAHAQRGDGAHYALNSR